MTPQDSSALLQSLQAAHGPDVLASLVGAAMSADVAEAKAEAGGDLTEVSFDSDWFAEFAESDAFYAALSPDAASFFD